MNAFVPIKTRRPCLCERFRVFAAGAAAAGSVFRSSPQQSTGHFAIMSADGNADTGTAASPPPARGFCTTSHDTFCIRCGVSVCRIGVKDVGRHLAVHCRENEQCQLPVNANLTKLGKALELSMISKQDQYRRLGKGGCDWFEQNDPTDTYKCQTCDRLYATEFDAKKHCSRGKCRGGPPPMPADCHETISGVLVEVLARPLKQRRLDDTFAATVSANSASTSQSSTGKWLY